MNRSLRNTSLIVYLWLSGLLITAYAQIPPMKITRIQDEVFWASNGRKHGVQKSDIFVIVRQASKQSLTIGRAKVYKTLERFSQLDLLELYGNNRLRVGDLLLRQTEEDLESDVSFVGNNESRFIHKESLGDMPVAHLPPPQISSVINDISIAISQGWKKCPICFRKVNPQIKDYLFERQLGLEMAAQLRYYYPLSVNESLSEYVTRVGNQVLSRWMFSLKGYKYTFSVLESEEINAFACPSGIIYVTKSFLDIIESDAELEAIIAHEIGHIENRHGLRLFRFQQGLTALMSIASALVTGVAEVDFSPVLNFSKLLIINGYGRGFEEEADFLASLYLEKTPQLNSRALGLVLRKFKDLDGRIGGFLSSHPNINERVSTIESTRVFQIQFPIFEAKSRTVDISGLGLEFLFGTIDNKQVRLYGTLKKTPNSFFLFRDRINLTGLRMKHRRKTLKWNFESLDLDALQTDLTVDFLISAELEEIKKESNFLAFRKGTLVDEGFLDRIEIILGTLHPKLVSKKILFVRP